MRTTTIVVAVLLLAASVRGQPIGNESTTRQLLHELLRQGMPVERILGIDRAGIPRVCGTGMEVTQTSPKISLGDALPPDSRGWECIPSVIRNDGIETLRLEVNVNGAVDGVTLDLVSAFLTPQGPSPIQLLDDGLLEDRVAGDGIYTAGPFRYRTAVTFPDFYENDFESPAGLFSTSVGRIVVHELDGTDTQFLIRPEIGMLRSDIPVVNEETLSSDLVTVPHVVNVRTSSRETQRSLRFLEGDLTNVTKLIYASLPDAIDFFMFVSPDKLERLPRTSSFNFIAGIHAQVRTSFTGTGLSESDRTSEYGSAGRLQGINVLDSFTRGLLGNVATHELVHQWSSYTRRVDLGLSDGTGHYNSRSSAGSLVGGFQWIDNGDGSFMLNCGEGRNGATRAPPIDLYMMGLVEGDAVPTLHLNETINFATDCGELVESLVDITIDDIQAVHGVRDPGPESAQRNFRIAFVVESHNRLLNPTELTYFDILAAHYTRPIPPAEPAPYMGPNWPSVDQFFAEGTTWTSTISVSDLPIPTVSTWGMVAMLLAVLAGGAAVFGRRPLR